MAKKKKTTKKTNTTTAVLDEPDDEQASVQLPAETTEHRSSFDLATPAGLDLALSEHGTERAHVGGSLPLIAFDGQEQRAFVGRLVNVVSPDDVEFSLVTFDLLDHGRWLAGEEPDSCTIARVQIVQSYAIRDWTDDASNVGKVVAVKYLGQQRTKRAQSPLKLIVIEELTRKKTN